MNVLVVEDDDAVSRFLVQALGEAGYGTQLCDDGARALQTASEQAFDLILLDVMLPGLNGLEVCRRLRAREIRAPILMITARDTTEDKVQGLDAGADDYLVKPFQVDELLARVRAMLRRGASSPVALQVDDLKLDPATRQAQRGSKNIALSSTEYTLLEYLMRHAGSVLTRAALLEHVWQYDFDGNDNVLEVYISYLRRKIDRGHKKPLIHTVRGAGYSMRENES